MLMTAIILTVLGIAATLFGAWGRFSEAGQRHFDEMAGMIPYFSYYLGLLLLVVSLVIWVIIVYRLFVQPGE